MAEMEMRRRRLPVKDRTQRLLSVFLKRRREVTAVKEPEVFSAAHLEQLMRSGQWDDAEYYLERFLLPVLRCDEGSPITDILLINIRIVGDLAKIAAGGQEGSEVTALWRKLPPSPFSSGLKGFIAQMKSGETSPNLLKSWHKIELQRVDILMDMVATCPELQGDHVTAPSELPLTFVAAQHRIRLGPSRCKNKPAARTPSHLLARAFLEKKRAAKGECGVSSLKNQDVAKF